MMYWSLRFWKVGPSPETFTYHLELGGTKLIRPTRFTLAPSGCVITQLLLTLYLISRVSNFSRIRERLQLYFYRIEYTDKCADI